MSDTPNATQLDTVDYLSGVDQGGTLVGQSYWTWNQDNPTTYSGTSGAHKWSNDGSGNALSVTSLAGTAGGTVTYAFDPAANMTDAQKAAFVASLTLWSDEANITFVETSDTSTADVLLTVTSSGGTFEQTAPSVTESTGSTAIPDELPPSYANTSNQAEISFNNADDFGTLGSFTAEGGYSYSALTHEVGHLLGLGHSGPYNDGNGSAGAQDADALQYNAYDSRQWSVMSYIQPSDSAATYYNAYTVTGTSWTATVGNLIYQVAPETPMALDILAAQQLYGAPTSTALSGGQVFGFNCNITDASEPFFDFTKNVYPVITLWDAGSGNTLDLSGYSMACTVSLIPGTFSSVGGLTNNVGIAFGTAIDSVIGGSGNDVITVNSDNDTINGGGGTNTVDLSAAYAAYSFSMDGGDLRATDTATSTYDDLLNVQELQFTDQTVSAVTIEDSMCLTTGTRIATVRGEVAVEQLAVGERVRTAGGGTARIRWIGRRTIDCRHLLRPERVWPVRVAAGAFGPRQPCRDLVLSPDHAVFGEDVLVPVKYLINGSTVRREPRETVTYWHVELDRHDLLLAEGLAVESYLDTGTGGSFSGHGDAQRPADPATCEAIWESAGCAPLRIAGPAVERLREALQHGDAMPPPPADARTTADLGRLLDAGWYLAAYPDVAQACRDPAVHFACWGRREGRLPCPELALIAGLGLVDPATVVFTMPDVVAAGADPVAHFCSLGWRERRRPNPYFDTAWYLATHTVPDGMNPLLHYVLHGEPQGLPPGPHFDPGWYRRRYGLGEPDSPLAHYLRHRRTQRFSPHPGFDVACPRAANHATLRADRDPYAHLMACGDTAGRAAA